VADSAVAVVILLGVVLIVALGVRLMRAANGIKRKILEAHLGRRAVVTVTGKGVLIDNEGTVSQLDIGT
jgi:hypothetical protein